MSTQQPDSLPPIQRDLASWHSTHPDATFAEMEVAVEDQLDRLRNQLLEELTEAGVREASPICEHCGTTMVPKARRTRRLVLRGDQELDLERDYLACPSCGAGFFPPR